MERRNQHPVPNTVAAYNKNGDAKYDSGDYDGAIADYNKVIEFMPNNPGIFFNRGRAKIAKGDYNGGIIDCNKARDLLRNNAKSHVAIYNVLGFAKLAKGDYDGAISDCDKTIESKPNTAAAYNNRGYEKEAKGNVSGALEDCQKAVELSGSKDPIIEKCSQGLIDFINGNYQAALESWQKVLQQNKLSRHDLHLWIERARAKLDNS